MNQSVVGRRVRVWKKSSIARAALLLGGLALAGGAAWGADVDLVVAINVPTTTTLQPSTFEVDLSNPRSGSTATGAQLKIPLPANLYNVSVVSVTPTGTGAICPTPASITGVPAAGATTTGQEELVATFPSLPSTGGCAVIVAFTPLAANTYSITAAATAAAGDNEVNSGTNSAQGNTTTQLSTVPLKVDKTIVSGATAGASAYEWNALGYGMPVVYQVRFENQSTLDLPLGAMGDIWADWEGDWRPQSTPTSSTLSNVRCVSGPCPPLTAGTVGADQGTSITPFTADMTGYVLPAGQTVVLEYTRTYAAPGCGQSQVANDITWNVNRKGNFINPNWQANSYNNAGGPLSRTVLTFPQVANVPACIDLAIDPRLSKTLDRVTSADGNVTRPNFSVTADGDVARFTITIDNSHTSTANWPPAALAAGAASVPFSIWDVLRAVGLGSDVSPTVFPNGVATQEVRFDGCDIPVNSAGSVCPVNLTDGQVLKPASTDFGHGQSAVFHVAAGEVMTLRLSTHYALSQPVTCVRNNAQIENFVGLTVRRPPDSRYAYAGALYHEATTAGKVSLLPDTPRCVDVSSNKTISPSNSLTPGETITFTLDYVNSTGVSTANPYNAPTPLTHVGVADELGPNFRLLDDPSAVSCVVEKNPKGNTIAPTVSRADVSGPNNMFQTAIPSMDDGGVVRCTIKGTVGLPGSYHNVTTVALPAGSGFVDPYPTNDRAALNYGIVGPSVQLSKTGSLSGNTVTFVVTASSRGDVAANGTRIVDNMPTNLQGAQWTCQANGGAVCPTDGPVSGNIDQTLNTFPPGSSVTWTVTGTVAPSATAVQVLNDARADLPPGASCVTANPADPPSASPCRASATVDVPASSTPPGGGNVTAVPVDAPWALALLAAVMGGLAATRQRRSASRRR